MYQAKADDACHSLHLDFRLCPGGWLFGHLAELDGIAVRNRDTMLFDLKIRDPPNRALLIFIYRLEDYRKPAWFSPSLDQSEVRKHRGTELGVSTRYLRTLSID